MGQLGVSEAGRQAGGRCIPIAFTTAVLLGLFGINAFMAVLGKVSRQMLGRSSGAIGKAGMVTVWWWC
jgi:hypothetical protein